MSVAQRNAMMAMNSVFNMNSDPRDVRVPYKVEVRSAADAKHPGSSLTLAKRKTKLSACGHARKLSDEVPMALRSHMDESEWRSVSGKINPILEKHHPRGRRVAAILISSLSPPAFILPGIFLMIGGNTALGILLLTLGLPFTIWLPYKVLVCMPTRRMRSGIDDACQQLNQQFSSRDFTFAPGYMQHVQMAGCMSDMAPEYHLQFLKVRLPESAVTEVPPAVNMTYGGAAAPADLVAAMAAATGGSGGSGATVACGSCSNALSVDDKFCNKCGTPNTPVSVSCSKCDASNDADSRFCSKCGNNMQAAAESGPSAPGQDEPPKYEYQPW